MFVEYSIYSSITHKNVCNVVMAGCVGPTVHCVACWWTSRVENVKIRKKLFSQGGCLG